MSPEQKFCALCGRVIEWRRKWADCWDDVKFCSGRCRRDRAGRRAAPQLEKAILELLAERGAGKTICPSEVARREKPEDWRPLMEPLRMAARRLVNSGRIEITQGGKVVDPSRAKGPIRLRLKK